MTKIYTQVEWAFNKETGLYEKIYEESYEYEGPLALCGGGGEPSGGGGGSQTTVQKADPWSGQQPYLTKGFEQAEQRFLNTNPTYFEGSTVVPYSDETNLAMDMTKQRALSGSPITNSSVDELTRTLNGDYLYGGDGFNRAVEAATNRALPGIDSQFELSGRYGSGLAQEARARAVGDAFADQYGQERTNQLRAMMFAPQVAEMDYNDIGKLAAVGAQKEALQQETLADQVARHDFDQSVKQRQLQEYMNLVQGNYGSTTTQTSPAPQTYSNRGSGMLGGALMGMKGASMFGTAASPIGPVGLGMGGLLGGLLGGVF